MELIAVLSISAVVAVWASGFFGSQLTVYRKHMQLYQAESMGDAAAFKITSRLEQSVSFRIDPGKDDVLYYLEGEDWNSLTQEDIDQVSAGDYRVKLDFSDTEPEIAVVYITILYKEEEIHTRKIELPALYGQQEAEQMEGTQTYEKESSQEK